MRRVLFLVVLALAVAMLAPSALAENGPKFTNATISPTSTLK